MFPVVLLGLAAGAAALQEGSCDYSIDEEEEGNDYCIQETVKVETEFSFEPLFPDGAKFVYATDNLNTSEIGSGVYGQLATLAGWWLEYDTVSLDNSDAVYGTKMRTLYVNVSEHTGGGNNGCDDLLGSDCVPRIAEKLKELYFSEELADPISYLTDIYEDNWQEEIGDACPQDMNLDWYDIDIREGTSNDLGSFSLEYLATEMPEDHDTFEYISEDAVMPSRNWSLTYSRVLSTPRTFAEQLSLAAVTIIMRSPPRDSPTNQDMDFTDDDIQVAVVCAKPSQEQFDEFSGDQAVSGGEDGGSDEEGGEGEGEGGGQDAATMAHAPFAAVLAVALGTGYWMMGP